MIIAFDLDGTLIETHYDIADAMNAVLQKFGHKPILVEQQREMPISNFRNYLEAVEDYLGLKDDAARKEWLAEYMRIYGDFSAKKAKAFTGMGTLLEMLKTRGNKLAVISNKPQNHIEYELARAFPSFNFDAIVGPFDENSIHKPNPDYIQRLWDIIPKGNMVYIGDAYSDYLFAKNIGSPFIGVEWGYGTHHGLRDAEGKICANIQELFEELLRLGA